MNTTSKRYCIKYRHNGHDINLRFLRDAKNPDKIAIFDTRKAAEAIADRLRGGKVIDLDTIQGVGMLMQTGT